MTFKEQCDTSSAISSPQIISNNSGYITNSYESNNSSAKEPASGVESSVVYSPSSPLCEPNKMRTPTPSMPINEVPLDIEDEMMIEIREVSTELLELLKDYPQWCDKYLIIMKSAPEVIAWAKEYDYNGIRANGYWSCIRMAIKLGKLVLNKYRGVTNPKVDKNLELLLDYALIALKVLKILREDSVKNTRELITSDPQYFVDLFGLLLSIDDEMVAAMYGRYCGFWLCDQSRYTMMFLVTILAIGARGLNGDMMRCLYDAEYRGLVLANLIKSADIDYVKSMGSLMEWRVYKQALPSLLYWNKPIRVREIKVRRQRSWMLSAHNVQVFKLERSAWNLNDVAGNNDQVRCLLYQNTSQAQPLDTLVIHMHGGGFIIGSPESHDVYIKSWCAQVPGCSILSVDYAVSPEHKFPVALQQLLDVYLHICSDVEELEQQIGFRPKQLVLAGDSAGGNLTMALMHVLADLNEQLKASDKPTVMKPKAIFNLYTPYNLTLNITPSMILASCDSMISAGVMLSCFEAYLPLVDLASSPAPQTDHRFRSMHLKPDEEKLQNQRQQFLQQQKQEQHINDQNVMNDGHSLDPLDTGFWAELLQKNFYSQGVEKLQSMMKSVKSFIRPTEKPRPWYLADKPELEAKVERLKEITTNPYISPLLYSNFERHKDTKLFMVALHFDPFLDDDVMMARRWKGPVQLDVIDGLQHGWLNFMPFVDEARKANIICLQRLNEAIHC